jgi:hypothetical protein
MSTKSTCPVKSEYIRRIKLLNRIERDKKGELLELEMCKRIPQHIINNWFLTFDPRKAPNHLPFNLYEFQDKAVDWITERYTNKENGLIEKSRDMGVTWIVCAWAVHRWLFDTGFVGLFGSRKEKLVDNKLPDSIFGKIRYLVYRLPPFLRPNISPESSEDAYMRIVNPENDNQLVGESANINFGRGARSSVCFLDEFAHVQNSEAIWASISENSDCVIPLSTPNGKGNEFSRLRHDTNIPVLTIHWKEHPLKDDDWYKKKKSESLPWQIAQELDLSYERSAKGKVYQRFSRQWHVADEVIYPYSGFEQFVCWDFGIADPTAIIWGQITTNGMIEIYQCYELTGWDIDFFKPISLGNRPKEYKHLSEEDQEYLDKILKKVPRNNSDREDYGDHAGTARTANSKRSCKARLAEGRPKIKLKTSSRQSYDYRFECLDALLKLRHNMTTNKWYSIFKISPDCTRLIDCLNNYKWDAEDDVNDDKLKPKHDWASHMVTALEFFAINRFPIKKKPKHRSERIR